MHLSSGKGQEEGEGEWQSGREIRKAHFSKNLAMSLGVSGGACFPCK